jgi:hypothetical protein
MSRRAKTTVFSHHSTAKKREQPGVYHIAVEQARDTFILDFGIELNINHKHSRRRAGENPVYSQFRIHHCRDILCYANK